jgi:hypothetical protein
MTQCPNGSWCCGANNNTDCCNISLGFQLAPTLVSFDSSNTSATVTATVAVTVTTIATSTTSASKSSDNTTKVGVGVGVALGVLAIAAGFGGFWAGQKRERSLATGRDIGIHGLYMDGGGSLDTKAPMLPYGQQQGQIHEVGEQGLVELENVRA